MTAPTSTTSEQAQDPNPIPLFFYEAFVLSVALFVPLCLAIFLIGIWISSSLLIWLSGLSAMAWFIFVSLSDILKNLKGAGRSDRVVERHGLAVALITFVWHVTVTYLVVPVGVTYVSKSFLPSFTQAIFAGCIAESLFLYWLGRKRFLGSVFKFHASAKSLRDAMTKLLVLEKAKTRSDEKGKKI